MRASPAHHHKKEKGMELLIMESERKMIEQMFFNLILDYGRRLREHQRETAMGIFDELLDNGFNYELLYWALWNLGDRDIIKNKRLLFSKSYQEEVRDIAKRARELNMNYNPSLYEIEVLYFSTLAQYRDTYSYIEDEVKEKIMNYEDRFFNREDYNLTDEEKEEVRAIYIKWFLSKDLSVSKEECKKERETVINQLKDANIFVDYRTIPFHAYQR